MGWNRGQPELRDRTWPTAGCEARSRARPGWLAGPSGVDDRGSDKPGADGPRTTRIADAWSLSAGTARFRRCLNERPKVPVTVFPAGTENLVAQQFGLRRDADRLARIIAEGQPRRVDLGTAEGRRFLLMVGFGFDGDVVSRHHHSRMSRLGRIRPTHRLAYVWPVLRSSFSYKFPRINVRIENDGVPEVLSGTTVFIFNAPRYALGLPFVPGARDDDGWLDLLIFRDPGPFQALYYLWRVFRGTHLTMPDVFHRRVKTAFVTTEERVPVQIDGDPGGLLQKGAAADGSSAGWTVEIVPQAIEVFAPEPPGRA